MSTSPPSAWDTAWEAAQPRLIALRAALGQRNDRDAPITRVGQLDAEILDQELISVLQEPLNKALVLIDATFKGQFEPELTLLIHMALYKLSIWNSGASYGAKLQDLRYTIPHKTGGAATPSGLPRRLLLIHGALTIVAPYIHSRLRAYSLSRAWPDAPTSDIRRKAWDILVSLESAYTVLSLGNFMAFLCNGRFRTIADRVLNMQLVPSLPQVRRDVSYEYMNRQMVWHAFTEFLLFLLPLINARKLRRRVNRVTASISSLPSTVYSALISTSRSKAAHPASRPQTLAKYHTLPQNQCAICAENASYNLNMADSLNAFTAPQDTATGEESELEPPAYPIYTPYITSCGHIYCYSCIAERMMRTVDDGEDEGWECLRCAAIVKEADRHMVAIEDEGSEMGATVSDYDFSSDFDIDTMDLSGSIGSYSESGMSSSEEY